MTNMSLDNTSRPGGPGPDELVPSRYAPRSCALINSRRGLDVLIAKGSLRVRASL